MAVIRVIMPVIPNGKAKKGNKNSRNTVKPLIDALSITDKVGNFLSMASVVPSTEALHNASASESL